PEERITLPEALRAYTLGAAYASGKDHLLGSLRPGKLADLLIIEKDVFHLPPEEILDPGLRATVVGGRVVFGGL
ncbi:MAG: amidohydrolase family protein, partial [Firmicutes bacterium]|nr:amidohydrolase family protein [Bacillota bacterium]